MPKRPYDRDKDQCPVIFLTINPLSRAEEARLIPLAQAGDEEAACTIIRANTRFVKNVAAKYKGCGLTTEELISEGLVGMHTALMRFDCSRGMKFISYGVWWIRQQILFAINNHRRSVRLPLNQITQLAQIRRRQAVLSQEHGRAVTRQEAAKDLTDTGTTMRLTGDGNTQHYATVVSLDDVVCGEARNERNALQRDHEDPDATGRVEGPVLANERREAIVQALAVLGDREREVIGRYYGLVDRPYTMEEIGGQLGITRERVRQIRNKAIRKLRHHTHLSAFLHA